MFGTIGRKYSRTTTVSFVERFIILCPYFGESTVKGLLHIMCAYMYTCMFLHNQLH